MAHVLCYVKPKAATIAQEITEEITNKRMVPGMGLANYVIVNYT